MIKKFLNHKLFFESKPSHSVTSAAFVITVAGLASRLLGLVRDRFLASTFGASDILDVYYAAFRVPDLIYNLLILGALSAAFIPVFTGLIVKDKKEEAWEVANGVLNLTILSVVFFSFFFCVFAPYFMRIITPGFSPEKMDQTVLFTRIMFLSPFFLGISGIFGGVLTSFKRFLIYSLGPILYNLGIICGVVVFVRLWGAVGLAWGVAFGSFLHMLIQYPAARQLGFRYAFGLKKYWHNQEIRKIFRLMLPRTMGIAVSQINLFVITIFASTLAAGSLAVFNFAQNLQSVPLGIFGISFSIAVFPTLSIFFAQNEKKEFAKAFSETFCQIMFFVIPLSVFMLLLRAQIVRVALGAGEFNWEDTTLTFECLKYFSLSLFAQSSIPLLTRSFYAVQNTKTPFYIAIFSEMVNIGAVIFLISRFEILGLAMAYSAASLVQMFLLFVFLRVNFDDLGDEKIVKSVAKISLATIFSGVSIQLMKLLTESFVGPLDAFWKVFVQLVFSGAIGAVVFLAFCHLFRLEEYFRLKRSLHKRLFGGKKFIGEDISEVSGV